MNNGRRSDDYVAPVPARTGSSGKIFAASLQSLVLLFGLPALCHPAQAQTGEIAPFIGQRYGGSFSDAYTGASFGLADDTAFGLVLDFDTEPDKQIEVYLSRQNTRMTTGDPLFTGNSLFDLAIDYYHVGGLYMLPDEDSVLPYVHAFITGTIGITRMAPARSDLSTETRLSTSLGIGAKVYITRAIGLRLDMRGIFTALHSDTAIFCSGGCSIWISSSGFVQAELSAALMMRF